MSADADPPTVCPHCLQALRCAAAQAGTRVLYVRCDHQGAGTLLRIEVLDSAIVGWRLSAPISRHDAQKQVTRECELLAELGLLSPPPRLVS